MKKCHHSIILAIKRFKFNASVLKLMGNNSRFFFVLLSAAAAIGIGNIWLFPHYSFNHTGLFIVPYFISLIILAVPLLMLEFSAGQYFDKNVVDLFGSIRKQFSSVGWLMVFNSFILMSLYAVILSWHIIYLFVSFGLQWKKDAESYFFNNVVQISEGFRNFTSFSLPVFTALILAWLLVFLYIKNGYESMKKGVLAAFPIFIILLLGFFAYALSLDNALNGIYSFLRPNFRSLLEFNVWIDSFSLAILSLGISFGVIHSVGRRVKGFIAGNSSIAAAFELLVSIAAGFIVFAMVGFLSLKRGISPDSLATIGLDYQFTALAQALPFFYMPTLLSILFFALLLIFFIFGTALLAYSISGVLVHKFRTKSANAAVFVAGLGFLFGLLFIVKPGFYIMDIVMHFIAYNILIALLLEVIAIGWIFDSERLAQFISQNSVLKIGNLWRFLIRYAVPLILLLLLLFRMKSDYLLDYNGYPWIYVLIFGVGTVAIPIAAAFLMPRRIFDRR